MVYYSWLVVETRKSRVAVALPGGTIVPSLNGLQGGPVRSRCGLQLAVQAQGSGPPASSSLTA